MTTCRAYVSISGYERVEAICRDCGQSEEFDPSAFKRRTSYQEAMDWTRNHNMESRINGPRTA